MRSRKMFIGRVFVPGLIATNLADLMKASALLWGLEPDGVSPSLDSIIGSECIVVSDGAVKIGSDNTTGPTVGITKAAAAAFSLSDYGPDFGIIDPTQIWFWPVSQSGVGMDVTFTAR
jgi:hypothetical protein